MWFYGEDGDWVELEVIFFGIVMIESDLKSLETIVRGNLLILDGQVSGRLKKVTGFAETLE